MKTYKTIEELIKDINKARLSNKNNWVFFDAYFKGYFLQFKLFGTWVQRLEINTKLNGLDTYKLFRIASSNMDISVKDFKEFIEQELITLN